jgi:hypothetical protein
MDRDARDLDGWHALDPRWQERVDETDALALVVEAGRRATDLRDVLAEAGSAETSRALLLNTVLNSLFDLLVRERADGLGLSTDPPHGRWSDTVPLLHESGLLSEAAYRSTA